MTAALFGITNDALNLVVNLLLLFLVVFWFALVAWTYFDARRRLEDAFLVLCATACSLIFPFVGTIVYSILRPPEFIADMRERELEIRAAELRVRQLEAQSCPNCEYPVERTFLRCPSCRSRIKDPCETCGKPIDPRWSLCPYCETPVRRAAPPERRGQPKRRAKPTRSEPARERSAAARAERKAAAGSEPPPKPRGSEHPAPRSEDGAEGAREPAPTRQPRTAPRTTQQRTTSRPPKRSSE